MYAIIRTGGKQAKVREGDVIDVERLRAEGDVSFTPLLVVDGEGKVFSSRKELASAKVVAKVIGEAAGEKIDIFKYKAKTGYRRRGGHRQRYTTIEVTKIQPPKSSAAAAEKATEEAPAATAEEAKTPAAKKPAAKASTAKKPAAKKSTAKEPAAKKLTAKEPAAKKPAAKKSSDDKAEANTGAKPKAAAKPKAPAKAKAADKTEDKAPADKPAAEKEDSDGA
jgi:large subunit ribosomal protein L21